MAMGGGPLAGPLEGLLVADFSRILAGPYATMLLADLGADVVKVEGPQVTTPGPGRRPCATRSRPTTWASTATSGPIALDLNDADDAHRRPRSWPRAPTC